MASDADTGKDDQLPRAIKISLWLTGAWMVLLLALITQAKPCASVDPWWDFFHRHLACREVDSIGNFLAGAFAPLAFLWLVVTVLIQAQELKAQRAELKLTRQEFVANRGVAEATQRAIEQQSETARVSAEFVGRQTEIQGEQLDQQRQNATEERIARLLKRTHTVLRRKIVNHVRFQFGERDVPLLPLDGGWSDESEDAIAEMSTKLVRNFRKWTTNPEATGVRDVDRPTIVLLHELLMFIRAERPGLSSSALINLDALGVDELRSVVETILGIGDDT